MIESKRKLSVAFLFLLCLGVLRAGSASADQVFRDLSLDRALVLAAEQKCLVLVDFFVTPCGACQKLEDYTWKDKQVIALLKKKTIPLRIDAGKEVAFRQKYSIRAYPTLLLLKPDGSIQDRILGYQPPKQFLEFMEGALAKKSSHSQEPQARTISREAGAGPAGSLPPPVPSRSPAKSPSPYLIPPCPVTPPGV